MSVRVGQDPPPHRAGGVAVADRQQQRPDRHHQQRLLHRPLAYIRCRIEFYGVGNSGIVAQDAQHKFFRLGVNAIAYSDGHMQVMSASMLKPGDCAVIISNSGRTRDLMDACDIAKKQGATTIVITASGSPLAAAGHIHLAADHPEGYDRYSPMVSRLLHLLIIDILATTVALRIGESLQPALREMKHNLRSKRYT